MNRIARRAVVLMLLVLLTAEALCASPGTEPAPQLPSASQPAGANTTAPSQLTLEQYRAELAALAEKLETLDAHPEEASALRESLPDKYTVVEGRKFVTDLAPLKKALEQFAGASPQHREQLLTAMRAKVVGMRAGADAYGEASDATAARGTLQAILARREFSQVRGPTLLEIWRDRVARWILSLLDRIFGNIRPSQRGNHIVLWILIAVTAVVLALWLKRLAQRRQVEVIREPIPFAPSDRNWRAWLADARAAATQGHWREAIHFAYWAAISHLEDSGAWAPDRARTPREYLRLISSANSARPTLSELTLSFERTWYGQQPAGAEDYQHTLQQVETLGCR